MMRFRILVFLIICCSTTHVNSASKYYDGPIRPYEFGFSIEGNQHRHEKKDEKGIIMGEFGFITADGVYHITVYATDENGNFKIISMKNIKIGLPGENKGVQMTSSRGSSAAVGTTRAPLSTISLPTKPTRTTKKPKPGVAVSCSSCLIPKKPGDESGEDDSTFNQDSNPSNAGRPSGSQQPSKGSSGSNNLFNPLSNKINKNEGSSKSDVQNQGSQISSGGRGSFAQRGGFDTTQQQQGRISPTGQSGSGSIGGDNRNLPNGGKLSGQGQQPSSNVRNQVSTPSLSGDPPLGKSVGEGAGGILYKFNYTVGYHGHHEQGDYDGIKDGGYHFVGRDGYRRTIDYLANEFGYQPYLKLEQADDKDVPKEETEKEAGLKGYEFKWFNKPE